MWWKRSGRDGLVVPGVPLVPGQMDEAAAPLAPRAAERRNPPKPFHVGDGFTLANTGKELITYSEGWQSWELLAAWGVTPPELGIPRPELWDYVVPSWLTGRYEIVKDRLVKHSGHRIVFDPDDWYTDKLRSIPDDTEETRGSCPCCDADVVAPKVAGTGRTGPEIDMFAAHQAVMDRVADGRFQVIRSDVPLEQTLALFDADTKYTICSVLRCTVSDETVLWGLNIRGVPVYKHVRPTRAFTWPWDRDKGYPRVDNAPARP